MICLRGGESSGRDVRAGFNEGAHLARDDVVRTGVRYLSRLVDTFEKGRGPYRHSCIT